jgi:hypothetical protein
VTLKVYDALGREVADLVNAYRSAGFHTSVWDGNTVAGGRAASGMYMYRLTAGDVVQTGRMLLAK